MNPLVFSGFYDEEEEEEKVMAKTSHANNFKSVHRK
jgi:hypothetical protein